MKKNIIRLNEKQLERIVEKSVKRYLQESIYKSHQNKMFEDEDYRYMSDDDIACQYKNMEINDFYIEHLKYSNGWSGYFDVYFPNADDIDYDSYKHLNFIVYDEVGKKIAWDDYLSDDIVQDLENIIKNEIRKRL